MDIVAEMGESIVASCIAYGSPAPDITWSLIYSSVNTTHSSLTTTHDSSVYTNQFVKNGVGIVYSVLLLCPEHNATLTTSHLSCTTSNGVTGGNTTTHSFQINVSGIKYRML